MAKITVKVHTGDKEDPFVFESHEADGAQILPTGQLVILKENKVFLKPNKPGNAVAIAGYNIGCWADYKQEEEKVDQETANRILNASAS